MKEIHQTTLSAIIACYKDEKAIPVMYERLTNVFRKIGCEYEIIFVNDGSPDQTEEVLKKITDVDQRVTSITHTRNFNSQNAFTSGMVQSIGDAVILLDGDLQDPPELIESFFEKWRQGYDVVYGERVKRQASLFLQVSYKLFYRIFQKLSYVRIPLNAGDFSLIDRRVVDILNGMPERNRFLRGLRAWVGLRQIGVPYVRPERMFGVTTNNIFGNIRWAKNGILSLSYMPLEWISYLAMSVVSLSIVGMIFYGVMYFINPGAPKGTTTIILCVLFLGGIQLLCLSIIGEYLGIIFQEVKQRPKFIVKEIVNDHKKRDYEHRTDGAGNV
jgi:polyisoprenyl-phosphate glycosyltransferase